MLDAECYLSSDLRFSPPSQQASSVDNAVVIGVPSATNGGWACGSRMYRLEPKRRKRVPSPTFLPFTSARSHRLPNLILRGPARDIHPVDRSSNFLIDRWLFLRPIGRSRWYFPHEAVAWSASDGAEASVRNSALVDMLASCANHCAVAARYASGTTRSPEHLTLARRTPPIST